MGKSELMPRALEGHIRHMKGTCVRTILSSVVIGTLHTKLAERAQLEPSEFAMASEAFVFTEPCDTSLARSLGKLMSNIIEQKPTTRDKVLVVATEEKITLASHPRPLITIGSVGVATEGADFNLGLLVGETNVVLQQANLNFELTQAF